MINNIKFIIYFFVLILFKVLPKILNHTPYCFENIKIIFDNFLASLNCHYKFYEFFLFLFYLIKLNMIKYKYTKMSLCENSKV